MSEFHRRLNSSPAATNFFDDSQWLQLATDFQSARKYLHLKKAKYYYNNNQNKLTEHHCNLQLVPLNNQHDQLQSFILD